MKGLNVVLCLCAVPAAVPVGDGGGGVHQSSEGMACFSFYSQAES